MHRDLLIPPSSVPPACLVVCGVPHCDCWVRFPDLRISYPACMRKTAASYRLIERKVDRFDIYIYISIYVFIYIYIFMYICNLLRFARAQQVTGKHSWSVNPGAERGVQVCRQCAHVLICDSFLVIKITRMMLMLTMMVITSIGMMLIILMMMMMMMMMVWICVFYFAGLTR